MSAQHLLTSCVFAWQLCFHNLQPLNLASLVPTRRTLSFADWCKKSARKVQKEHRKGFKSFVILGAWNLWKHRNACVFDGSPLSIPTALQAFKDESHLWVVGGAEGLLVLGLGSPT